MLTPFSWETVVAPVVAPAKKSHAAPCRVMPSSDRPEGLMVKGFSGEDASLCRMVPHPAKTCQKPPILYGVQEVAGSNPVGPIFLREESASASHHAGGKRCEAFICPPGLLAALARSAGPADPTTLREFREGFELNVPISLLGNERIELGAREKNHAAARFHPLERRGYFRRSGE
jgi:hypothetical protein